MTPSSSPSPSISERLIALYSTTTPIPPCHNPDPDNPVPGPGERYLWSTSDAEIPHELRTLTQAAADLLAIEREDLQKAARQMERRIMDQMLQEERKERREKPAPSGGDDSGVRAG